MQLTNIHYKGYNLSIILNGFVHTNLNTITNTVTIQRSRASDIKKSTFDTEITIKKEMPTQLNVNNKK
jgi:hypothetical protein